MTKMKKLVVPILLLTIASLVAASELPKMYAPISAHLGETVELPCITNLSTGVDWWNLESPQSAPKYVLARGYVQNEFRPRFNVAGASEKGDYSLFIFNAQHSDSGYYVCFEDAGFGNSHGYQLAVSDKPLLTTVGMTSQSSDGLHPAEVALIVILILFPVIIAAAIIFWFCIRRRSKGRRARVEELDEETNKSAAEVPLLDVASSAAEETCPSSADEECEAADIASKLAEIDSERSRMKSEMKATTEQQERLRQELERDSEEQSQLKTELEKIKQNNAKLQAEVDSENKKIAKLEFRLEQLRKLSVQQLGELQTQKEREAELNEELERVKESEMQLKGELEKEKELRQKEKENQAHKLQNEKERLIAELKQIQNVKQELENKIEETRQKENKLSDKQNKAKRNEGDLVQLLKREAAKVDQQKSKLKDAKQKNEKLRNELNSEMANVTNLKKRIERMEEQERWMKGRLKQDKMLQNQLKEAAQKQQTLEQHVNQLISKTDRVDELEEQVRQMSEREQRLRDELTKTKHQQQQQQQMMMEDNRRRQESQTSSRADFDFSQSNTHKQDKADREVVMAKKEKELRLMDQLTDVLQETAEKTDRKQKEFSGEIQQQLANFVQQKSSSSQDALHQTWQMVNDLDTLSSQPDVESLTRQEFKQKVKWEKWVPRNKEYVQKGLDELRREMAALQDGSLRGVIEEISSTVRDNVKRSLELVDQLKNASGEEKT